MNNIEQLKENIRQYIRQNGNREITGEILQEILLAMVDELADGGVIDTSLSLESENPVQNKAIKAALDKKVDTATGMGLSQENFTTVLKNKLNAMPSITNYDAANDRITIGSKTYQLTEYVPIPDFYAFFGNVKYTEGAWNFQTNGGSWKTFSALTAEDLMAVATAQGEGGGNMIKTTAQKITLPTKNHGSVKCDYVKNDYNGGGNALLILSKANVTLDFTIITSALESHYIYNRSQTVDQFNHNMDKSNLEIGTGKYNLRVYKATSGTLDGNSFGINYNN